MDAYYNENNAFAAQWLRNLIEAGHIAPGFVDERSITDVNATELLGKYSQYHFFAGIGIWSAALRHAGWADDRPVITGSCPCQPFSSAGKGDGFNDERHLWPIFRNIVEKLGIRTVIGEQVASKIAEPWLDAVQTDLEALDYAFGALAFPASGVGAPHIRDRLYWAATRGFECTGGGVADAVEIGCRQGREYFGSDNGDKRDEATERRSGGASTAQLCSIGRVDNTNIAGLQRHSGNGCDQGRKAQGGSIAASSIPCGLDNAELQHECTANTQQAGEVNAARSGEISGVGNNNGNGCVKGDIATKAGRYRSAIDAASGDDRPGPTNGEWSFCDWLSCIDGNWRAVMPDTWPMVDGHPFSLGRLRTNGDGEPVIKAQGNRNDRIKGYGNAIVLPQAALFIESIMEIL